MTLKVLDLGQVDQSAFEEDFQDEFLRRLRQRRDLSKAVRFEKRSTIKRPSRLDSSAGWTNVLLNMMIEWLGSEGAWTVDGVPLVLSAQPKWYKMRSTGKNSHDREYQWDVMAGEREGPIDEAKTWRSWAASPRRSKYRGAVVAVESEWGGELSPNFDTAADLMVADFYKLCDAPVRLGVFIHWEPKGKNAGELARILRLTHGDHRAPPSIVCIGFQDIAWKDLFGTNDTKQPKFRWLHKRR
jgi:hypothetical protein